ncbi:MAG: molecular chaperone HtpG [Candidatus Methanomethylophilaceae archaeon]|nr:molecular chaperone HtpG [Candidatus Methanomethylophilaceae archaeon]MBR6871369.1 molecular chaperone HtpG [Candidatus Methanomethylophilaceae archaeon]
MAKKQFKTESKQLLNLMINSIYTHKEIFLREIISNASDAIDKLHYKAITESLPVAREDFKINVSWDEDARTITVSDNGIGMNKEDMDSNLGVIAHSGSLDFKKAMEENPDVDIIGQFGVGFYSAFLVSDKVTVRSKAYGEDTAWMWTSEGTDGYTVKECDKPDYGTEVEMHIKPDEDGENYSDFIDEYRIKELIKKYSDYVRWPIHMMLEKGAMEETGEKDEEGNPKKEWKTHLEDTVVNSMVPIWQRSKEDASDEDCKKFYKEKFHDFEDPISVIRVNAEGTVSYKAMLFIPKVAPYNFYSRDFEPGLQLYSSGVMIMDKCKDVLPDCFRFVRGVVDSPDLSLNISREMLQHDRQLNKIKNNIEKKIKNELERLLSDERDRYLEFYKSFGTQVKYGIVEGYGAKADLVKDLVLFHSMAQDRLVTLKEYVEGMPEGQAKIYYASAESVARAKQLPQTEQVRDKGYDILCMTEDVDEFAIRTLREYEEKEFCDIAGNDLGLETEEEKKEADAKEEEEKEILDFVKETIGDKVSAVKLSRKLKTHAVCLSTEGDVSLEMEKYFSSIPGASEMNQVKAQRVLEINGSHPAYEALKKAYAEDKDKAADMAKIMYTQALLIAGMPVDDIMDYSDMVFKLF